MFDDLMKKISMKRRLFMDNNNEKCFLGWVLLIMVMLSTGCTKKMVAMKDDGNNLERQKTAMEQINVPENFKWKTTQTIDLKLFSQKDKKCRVVLSYYDKVAKKKPGK
jgi:hypothetical protein